MNEFKTTDLYEAAYLECCGAKLLRLDGEGSQKTFVFETKKVCEKLSKAFWNKEATITVRYYADSIRNLKDRLFARGGIYGTNK